MLIMVGIRNKNGKRNFNDVPRRDAHPCVIIERTAFQKFLYPPKQNFEM